MIEEKKKNKNFICIIIGILILALFVWFAFTDFNQKKEESPIDQKNIQNIEWITDGNFEYKIIESGAGTLSTLSIFQVKVFDNNDQILNNFEEMPVQMIVGHNQNQTPENILLNKILEDKMHLKIREKNADIIIELKYIRQAINQEEIDEIIKKLEINNQPQIMLDQNILNTPLQEGQSYTSQSGLSFEVIKLGDGERPQITSTVLVHYHGTLEDGTVFDSSVDRDEKIEFPLARVIAGWQEGLQYMPVGSKFKFTIPAELAYGPERENQPPLAGKTLFFEVELFEIK